MSDTPHQAPNGQPPVQPTPTPPPQQEPPPPENGDEDERDTERSVPRP